MLDMNTCLESSLLVSLLFISPSLLPSLSFITLTHYLSSTQLNSALLYSVLLSSPLLSSSFDALASSLTSYLAFFTFYLSLFNAHPVIFLSPSDAFFRHIRGWKFPFSNCTSCCFIGTSSGPSSESGCYFPTPKGAEPGPCCPCNW